MSQVDGRDWLYTPVDYHGPDSFVFHVNDGFNDSNQATVSINITQINNPPYVSPSLYNVFVMQGGTVFIDLAGVDPDGDDLTFIIDELPATGILYDDEGGVVEQGVELIPSIPSVLTLRFEHGGLNTESDFFFFHVFDGVYASNEASVIINVYSKTFVH